MIKGKAVIELKNVETGEVERYEEENLVTHALDYIIDNEMSINAAPMDYCLSVAGKLLGGLMMFDGTLDEDADNIYFPTDIHIVGYAGRQVNTTDSHRGSLNSSETKRLTNGFQSVWDFGTNQANGQIKSLALTSAYGGQNPFRYWIGPRRTYRYIGCPENDVDWMPIRYDGTYLYLLKGNTSNHLMRLARVKMPIHSFGVFESRDTDYRMEVIASWNTLIHHWTYTDRYGTYTYDMYADDPSWYKDGRDGYFYALVGDGIGEDGKHINYFTIKYSDESYDKDLYENVNLGVAYYYSDTYGTGNCKRLNNYNTWHIIDGSLYLMSSSRKIVYIINIANVASKRAVQVIENSSRDYIVHMQCLPEINGGVHIQVYHYTYTSYEYRDGFVYPDGVSVIVDVASTEYDDYARQYFLRIYGEKLELINHHYNSTWGAMFNWIANYLGTINNLSTPITKTAAQTMRIIYTLTDVDE